MSEFWVGDIIQMGSNATRVMSKWGTVLADAVRQSAQPADMTILDKSGKGSYSNPIAERVRGDAGSLFERWDSPAVYSSVCHLARHQDPLRRASHTSMFDSVEDSLDSC